MSTTTPADDDQPSPIEPLETLPRTSFVEALLDNLPGWTVVAAAIAFLYLVWATIEILGRYLEGIPSVTP